MGKNNMDIEVDGSIETSDEIEVAKEKPKGLTRSEKWQVGVIIAQAVILTVTAGFIYKTTNSAARSAKAAEDTATASKESALSSQKIAETSERSAEAALKTAEASRDSAQAARDAIQLNADIRNRQLKLDRAQIDKIVSSVKKVDDKRYMTLSQARLVDQQVESQQVYGFNYKITNRGKHNAENLKLSFWLFKGLEYELVNEYFVNIAYPFIPGETSIVFPFSVPYQPDMDRYYILIRYEYDDPILRQHYSEDDGGVWIGSSDDLPITKIGQMNMKILNRMKKRYPKLFKSN